MMNNIFMSNYVHFEPELCAVTLTVSACSRNRLGAEMNDTRLIRGGGKSSYLCHARFIV